MNTPATPTAPTGGRFILVHPINPACCPVCGEFVDEIWHYQEPGRLDSTTVVACRACAGDGLTERSTR